MGLFDELEGRQQQQPRRPVADGGLFSRLESDSAAAAARAMTPSAAPSESTAPPPLPGATDTGDAMMDVAKTWMVTPFERVLKSLEAPANVSRWMFSHNPWLNPGVALSVTPEKMGRIAAGAEPGSNFRALLSQVPPTMPVVIPGGMFGPPGVVRMPSALVAEAANAATDPLMAVTGAAGTLSKAGRALKMAQASAEAARMEAVAAATRGADDAVAAAIRALRETRKLESAQATISAGASERTLLELGGVNVLPLPDRVSREVARIMGAAKRARIGGFHPAGLFVTERQAAPGGAAMMSRTAEVAGGVAQREALRRFAPIADEIARIAKDTGHDADVLMDAVMDAHEYSKAKQFENPYDWLSADEREAVDAAGGVISDELVESAWARTNLDIGKFLTASERSRLLRAASEATRLVKPNAPGFVDLRDWRGRIPTRLLEGQGNIKPNLIRRIRELESVAIQRAQAAADAEAVTASLVRARETFGYSAEAAAGLDPITRNWITYANTTNAAILDGAEHAGIPLSALLDERAYALHAMTPEGMEAAREWGRLRGGEMAAAADRLSARQFTEKHGEQFVREFRNMSAADVNRLAMDGKLQITGGKPVKLFYTNPFIAQAIREGHAASAVASRDLFVGAMAEYGVDVSKMAESSAERIALTRKGYRTVPNNIRGIGENFMFPPEVADLLQKTLKGVNDPTGMYRAVTRLNQAWKAYTLGLYPGYHNRNFISDAFVAFFLADVKPDRAAEAARVVASQSPLLRKLLRIDGAQTITVGRETMTLDDLARLSESRGATGPMGQNIAEFDRSIGEGQGIARTLRTGRRGFRRAAQEEGVGGVVKELDRASTDNALIRTSLAAGSLRENFMRQLAFIDRLDKGDTPMAAADFVVKYFHDYNDITDFERGLRNTTFPFLTWMRKNLPLQFEHLFTRPRGVQSAQYLRHAVAGAVNEGKSGMEDPGTAPHLRYGVSFPIGMNKDGDMEMVRTRGVLPHTDLATISSPQSAGAWVINSVNPFAKAFWESMTRIDVDRSARRFEELGSLEPQFLAGGTGKVHKNATFMGFSVPDRLEPWLQLITPLSVLDRSNPFNLFGTDTTPSPLGGAVRPYKDPAPALRYLPSTVGARPYLHDTEQAARGAARDDQAELSDIKRLLAEAQRKDDTHNIRLLERHLENFYKRRGGP